MEMDTHLRIVLPQVSAFATHVGRAARGENGLGDPALVATHRKQLDVERGKVRNGELGLYRRVGERMVDAAERVIVCRELGHPIGEAVDVLFPLIRIVDELCAIAERGGIGDGEYMVVVHEPDRTRFGAAYTFADHGAARRKVADLRRIGERVSLTHATGRDGIEIVGPDQPLA